MLLTCARPLYVSELVSFLVGLRTCQHPGRGSASAKGKVRPRIGHEGPEEDSRCSATLSLTSSLDAAWVVKAMPRPLYL